LGDDGRLGVLAGLSRAFCAAGRVVDPTNVRGGVSEGVRAVLPGIADGERIVVMGRPVAGDPVVWGRR
jgi:hypothetical protein